MQMWVQNMIAVEAVCLSILRLSPFLVSFFFSSLTVLFLASEKICFFFLYRMRNEKIRWCWRVLVSGRKRFAPSRSLSLEYIMAMILNNCSK